MARNNASFIRAGASRGPCPGCKAADLCKAYRLACGSFYQFVIGRSSPRKAQGIPTRELYVRTMFIDENQYIDHDRAYADLCDVPDPPDGINVVLVRRLDLKPLRTKRGEAA